MSIVTLQLGQCGNQVGLSFFDKMWSELQNYPVTDRECFFRQEKSSQDKYVARSVLIDMEPKVITQCLEHAGGRLKTWQYDSQNVVCQQSGSGNNWAYGYTVHGSSSSEAMTEIVRQEVERCDYFRGFLALQSLAGGTGSGLGSFVCDTLREEYPSSYLLNTVVWPYRSGEVIVQNYNTLLTMACLSESSDGVLILENDLADEICRRLLAIPKPSFQQMNSVLASHIASVLLPVQSHHTAMYSSRFSSCILPTIIQHSCAHPGYKLLDVKLIPQLAKRSREFSFHQWPGMLKHLHQMHIANSGMDEGVRWNVSLETPTDINKSISNILFLRGPQSTQCDVDSFRDLRMHEKAMYQDWHGATPFHCFQHGQSFNEYDKTAALLSNSQAMLPSIQDMVEKAHAMFSSKAYLHQYAAHGVDQDFFESCFLRLDQIVVNYKAL